MLHLAGPVVEVAVVGFVGINVVVGFVVVVTVVGVFVVDVVC